MPLDDPAVLLWDRALPIDAAVAGPRAAQARLALDKRLKLRGAAGAGLAVPAWSELSSGDGIPGGRALPAVLKPAPAVEEVDGRAVRLSACLSAGRGELERVSGGWPESAPVILQR